MSLLFISTIMPLVSAETLEREDFIEESFEKTVDYFDYVRTYASLHGMQTPADFDKWHANMYMTYINKSGVKLLYAGLQDITTDESAYLRIPMQSFIMHYKTNENNRDVIWASTFLMLMAFNETSESLYPDSPDRNDILYASFSLGFDLSALGRTLPVLNSRTEIIPLEHPTPNRWTWGMKYTNLTALWWQTWIDPNNPRRNSWPVALTVYDELTFTYSLTISPEDGKVTLQENHVIGRMRHLFIGLLPLAWVYYNSTGNYGMLGRKLSDETIYNYLENNNIKMSIINFQTNILADHETYSTTAEGQNVEDSEVIVSDTSIDTYTEDGEKIFTTDFESKPQYDLYQYNEVDDTETLLGSFDAVVKTTEATGFARNAGLFSLHMGLMKFLPLVVVHMSPGLFAKAVSTISDMSRANYFYAIAYPTYNGYRIEHDPNFTAYIAASQDTTSNLIGSGGLIVIALVIIAIGIGMAVFIARRKPRQY